MARSTANSRLIALLLLGLLPMSNAYAAAGDPAPAAPATAPATLPATSNAAQEAAALLLRGNAPQAITQYTEALKDQTLTNDRRGAIIKALTKEYFAHNVGVTMLDGSKPVF